MRITVSIPSSSIRDAIPFKWSHAGRLYRRCRGLALVDLSPEYIDADLGDSSQATGIQGSQ
jgi:hypothetical protein